MPTQFNLGAMLNAKPANAQYEAAAVLNAEIINCAKTAQENLYQMAMGFKKMRDDKLYKALGYDNFGDYCEGATGMQRRNVYRYIDIVEKLPEDFVSSMTQIGMTKLQLLSTINDEKRTEIIETTDLESSTVKELKEKIASLKTANERLMTKVDEAKVKAEKSSASESKAWGKVSVLQTDSDLQKQKISQLEAQVNDLENRPVEVAVKDNSEEIERLKHQLEQAQNELQERTDNQSDPEELSPAYIDYKASLAIAKDALKRLVRATAALSGEQDIGANEEFEIKSVIGDFDRNIRLVFKSNN